MKKQERLYLVVDGDDRPMTFDGDQYCYASRSALGRVYNALSLYTRREAKKNIARTLRYRNDAGFSVDGSHHLMPTDIFRNV